MVMELRAPLTGKVFVTGASGFIGGNLRDALLAGGAEVVSLVRSVSPSSKHGRSVAVDYADLPGLKRLMREERPDYVFHVAGATKGVTYDDFRVANVVPTQNLIEALASEHPAVRRFLFVSSLTAYGPSNLGPPKRESDTPRPVEHYGQSKLEAERVVESYGERVPWTIIRPPTVYGPGEVDVFALFRAAKGGINLFFGNEDKQMSAVYVDDLVQAMVDAAQSERTKSRGYFVTDGVDYRWRDFQKHVLTAVGRRTLRVNLPSFIVSGASVAGELLTAFDKKPRVLNRQKALMGAQQAWLCASDAAREDFGYRPRVDIAEGMRRTYSWYLENKWL
ncbi:MAG: UDP-glucose 4-epimerase [Myxococcaceae bacterium]|nr:UDP-glucose 4-epimerase [Myxococcaceae bacterium]